MPRINFLKEKALWVRRETLSLYKISSGFRLASSLSDVEIFIVLYYGKILNINPKNVNSKNVNWEERDRFVISKGHGAISLYPILADLGFFSKKELKKMSRKGSFLGDIPDTRIPGFETINGALGHGLGVGCGLATALKKKSLDSKVFVLSGDGELYEGAVWEAIMFASHHKLDNLILIIDNNKISMLDYCKNIIDLESLEEKFRAFKWKVATVNGHDVEELYNSLKDLKQSDDKRPKVLIANTIKGKGVSQLEGDSLCHLKSLKENEIIKAIEELK